MVKKFICNRVISVFIFLLLLIPGSVFALGVGNITANSNLNEPLDAEIGLLGVTVDDVSNLKVTLAPQDVFDRMGVDRTIFLDQLNFEVVEKPGGDFVILVTTLEPVREPFLNFLIEVNWQNGRLLREFTVLLDPPVFLQDEQAPPVETPEAAPPETFTVTKPKDTIETPPSAPVVQETPDISAEQPVAKAINYGPVERGEILWHIAERLRPGDVSVEQMMLALLKQNPKAFFGNNVSMLKEGAVLRIEDATTLSAIGVEEAIAEVARHHQDWLAYKRELAARQAVSAESADATPGLGDRPRPKESGADFSKLSAEKAGTLKLVTPTASDIEGSNAQAAALQSELDRVTTKLALASEAVEVAQKENSDLQSRLKTLEDQAKNMNRLVQLKDEQLRQLQALKGATVEKDAANNEKAPLEIALPESELDVTPSDEVVKAAAPEKKQPASLWDDPLTIGTLIGAVILLAVFGWVYGKRNRTKTESKKQAILAAEAEEPAEDFVPIEGVGEVRVRTKDDAEKSKKTDQALGEIDPISEADVYLAYDKFDKAESLLREAIKNDPDRHELKLKLLETFFIKEDREAFDGQAEELYAALGGQESPIWTKAVEMGQSLSPDNPLFVSSSLEKSSLFVEDEQAIPVESTVVNKIADEPVDDKQVSTEWKPEQVTDVAATVPVQEDSPIEPSEMLEKGDDGKGGFDLLKAQSTMESVAELDADLLEEQQGIELSEIDSESAEPLLERIAQNDSADVDELAFAASPRVSDTEEVDVEQAIGSESLSEQIVAMEDSLTELEDDLAQEEAGGFSLRAEQKEQAIKLEAELPKDELDAFSEPADLAPQESGFAAEPDRQTVFSATVMSELPPEESSVDEAQIEIANNISAPRDAENDEALVSQIEEHEKVEADEVAALAQSFAQEEAERISESISETVHSELDEALLAAGLTTPIYGESDDIDDEMDELPDTATSPVSVRQSTAPATEVAESEHLEEIPDQTDEDYVDDYAQAARELSHTGESSFFLLSDEVSTKLDLAKAYIEMGDRDGARDLLIEVMDEGNDRQKKEARILLSSAQ